MVEIAVAQFASGTDKDENLAAVRALVGEAAARDARVVVAPEYAMYTGARIDDSLAAAAEPLDGPWVTGVRAVASEFGVHVVVGITEALAGDDHVSNTLVAVAPDGGIAAVYRKIHLYDAFGFRESDVIRAGDVTAPATFTVDDLTFGMQTCYDLRFPEMTRRIVDGGADVLALPAQWVPGPLKEDHWTTLVRARAIENTMYVAAADQCGRSGSGNSMIVDPMGVVLASLGEQVGTARAELSAARIAEARSKNPALALRRFGVAEK
ncbi:carbon-nitrogen hydrolase family protein [Rhodococcus triatomae]|nr:amidohydrolase [Rhodococcus triatomae BKS 15-14]